MEQSIEAATDPLHAEIMEHRHTKGRQNKNTQNPVLITNKTESKEVFPFRYQSTPKATIPVKAIASKLTVREESNLPKKISVLPHLVTKYLK
jgi:hypothetical protein